MDKEVGVVIIGRNEGERLKRCLKSVILQTDITVYVDSGSSDDSVEFAESIGVDVWELDTSTPFSASRARNAGFEYLTSKHPFLNYIQFIDGDCELNPQWLSYGCNFLNNNPKCAIVAGRLKERASDKSVYNLLCDIEWNVPAGKVLACGGVFTIRALAFAETSGFNPTMIAGEEPELCYRLLEKGWTIYRLDSPMALHDAAITSFSQWWKRTVRSGYAYAQGYALHGRKGQGYCRKESSKIWFWALCFPLFVIILAAFFGKAFLIFFLLYLVQFGRIAFRMNKQLMNPYESIIYAFFIVIAKWPQFIGQVKFINKKLTRKNAVIVEYK